MYCAHRDIGESLVLRFNNATEYGEVILDHCRSLVEVERLGSPKMTGQ